MCGSVFMISFCWQQNYSGPKGFHSSMLLHNGFIYFSCAYVFLILDPVSKDTDGVSPCPGTLRSRWALVDTNGGAECDSIGSAQFELVGRGDDATDVLLTLAFRTAFFRCKKRWGCFKSKDPSTKG